MKDTALKGLWTVLVVFVIFLFVLSFGCAHHSYPSEAYLGEYIASRMEYNANNNKESLIEANKNWNMYLKARVSE
jgi:hypothetical protein